MSHETISHAAERFQVVAVGDVRKVTQLLQQTVTAQSILLEPFLENSNCSGIAITVDRYAFDGLFGYPRQVGFQNDEFLNVGLTGVVVH